MHRDNKVRSRSSAVVRGFAHEWRNSADRGLNTYISVANYLEYLMPKKLHKKQIAISICENLKDGLLAYVEFKDSADRMTVHTNLLVEKEIWELAKLGDPHSNFILAHELGHIVMHNSDAQPFSNDVSQRFRFLSPDESAECQADLFADNFLIPDNIVDAFSSVDDLARACNVPIECARRRYVQRRIDRRLPIE